MEIGAQRLCHVDVWEKLRGDQRNPPRKLEVIFEDSISLDKIEQAFEDSQLKEVLERKEQKDAEQWAWRAGYGSSRKFFANRMPWRLGPAGEGHVNLYNEHGQQHY